MDDWLPDGFDCNAFGDKGQILWRCSTTSLLWYLRKEGIVELLKISMFLLILFGLLFNTQPHGVLVH